MAEHDSSRGSMDDEDADLLAAAANDEQRLHQETAVDSEGESSASHPDSGSDYRNENGDVQTNKRESDDDDEEPSSSGEEIQRTKKTRRTRKISEDMLQLMEEQDCLRRSGRQRKEVQRLEVGQGSDSDDKPKSTRKRQKPDDWNGNSLSDSGDSSASSVDLSRRRAAPRRSVVKKTKRKRLSSSDYDSDDSAPRRSVRKGKTSQVDYRDVDSDNGIDDDDVLEWQEEEAKVATEGPTETPETVERVLKHRLGRPSAIGHATTYYNVEERGDPNADFKPTVSEEMPERQYLIKWVGWSHLHNTWESEASLHLMHAKGMKKIENYVKRLREINEWRRNADKEYIEYFDCEQEMSEELCEQYKVVERVIAHQVSRERGTDSGTEYYVKWCGLPYSECTWEDSALIGRWYQSTIDAYHERAQSNRIPSKLCQALRRRPKFHKFESMPEFLQPNKDSELELRDYQLDGLNWLLRAWCKLNSCILADEMGLGKTIQSISFLSTLYNVYDVYGPFLVVVPLSTMAAWQREFENWAPEMNVIVYMGDVISRDYIRQFEWYVPGTKRLKFNAVITTYEILLKDKSFLGGIDWAVLAVDEAHRLKNDEALLYTSLSAFSTNHRLLITGTPLQNSLKELWALLHFIMPANFQSWDEFESQHKETDHRGFASLHQQLQPYLLRRVKKDVEKSLPAKVEQILRVDMTVQQKQYYKLILTKNYKELSKGVKGSINGFINLVMELKKCCNHASLIRAPDYFPNDAQGRLQQLLKSSGKLILLDKLLCRLHETGHRVLIFSQMVMMLDILQEYLKLRRFPCQRLDGSMRSDLRKQALDHFNAPGSADFCFLLSTRAGGLGINLATADTVIIFDSDWNPQNDLQAMSRAHRIGQKKQVNIYRLVTKASVEEEIVERAKQKLVLDHLVIQRMDTTGKTVLSKNAVTGTSGSVPFDKQELTAILKFGAEELFKEKEGEEQELEVDIDNILQGAETRECDNQDNGSELLSAFKYANFAIDEEKDLAQLDQRHKTTGEGSKERPQDKDWDDIIPETERRKIEEEERQQLEADLFLGPRQRNKVQQMARGEDSDDDWDKNDPKKKRKRRSADSGAESPSDESDEDRPRAGGKNKKKVLFKFSEAEIRKFVRSFRKFAKPLTRLEAVAQDAELEDHSTAELQLLADELIKGCQEAAREYEKNPPIEKKVGDDGKKKQDRGPVCKLGGIDVYVRPMLKVQSDLEPLDMVMPKDRVEWKHFRVPGKPRPQKGWDVEWDDADDSALLRGIFQYGMGSWEAIKMDPDLGLVEKIWLKDKNKKPQAKHIQSRADYLLKYLAKHTDINKGRVRVNKNVSIDGAITAVLGAASETKKVQKKPLSTKVKEKKEKEREQKKHEVEEGEIDDERPPKIVKRDSKPKKVEKPLFTAKTDHMVVNSKKYGSDLKNANGKPFQECIQAMRPVQKAMRKLVNSEELSSGEAMRNLLKVGDHIEEYLADQATKSATKATLDKWHSYLWIFLSRFTDQQQDPNDLLQQYRVAVKTRNDNPDLVLESSHHHSSAKHHEKEKEKHHHHHHHHHQDHSHATSSTNKPSSDQHRHRDRSERSSSSATREGYRRDEKPTNSHRYNDQPNPMTSGQKRREGGARSPTGWSHSRYTEPRYQQPRTDRGYNDPVAGSTIPNPQRQHGQPPPQTSPWKQPISAAPNPVGNAINNNVRDWRR